MTYKICPLSFSISTTGDSTICIQSNCAWWIESENICAIVYLATAKASEVQYQERKDNRVKAFLSKSSE